MATFVMLGLGGVAARQSQPVGVLRVVPGTQATTKGLTGDFRRSRGRAAGVFLQSPIILGRMRLRSQAASRERCLLRRRPTIRSVRASCTRRFFWRLIERNNYELAGSHCGIQSRPRQAYRIGRLPVWAAIGSCGGPRFVPRFIRELAQEEVSTHSTAWGWPPTTPSSPAT